MSVLHIDHYLEDNTQVKLGDVLVSNNTHDVVVMLHKERNQHIAVIIDQDDIWFPLKEFIQSNRSLVVDRNVNLYKTK